MSVRRFLLCLPATLLALVIAAPVSAQEGPTFTDTVGTSHEVAVDRLVAAGLVQGCREDRFCSSDDLTRGQMASILSRALELGAAPVVAGSNHDAPDAAGQGVASPFVDTEGSVHAEAIDLLAAAGLVNGCEPGRFCPHDSLTRGQLASMLVAAFDLEPAAGTQEFFIDGGRTHGANVATLGANGISNGCGPVTFCTQESVRRSHAALFLTRTLGLTEPVTLAPFEERLAEHEEREQQRRERERIAEQERLERERIEAEQRREREERERLEAPGRAAVEVALAQRGKPYQWGGTGPNRFDCSGLVYYAWREANGVTLPRTSRQMYNSVTPISRAELRPGDLVFSYSPVSHVAMYIGDGRTVDAPSSGGTVGIRDNGLTRRGVVGYGRPNVSP